MMNESPDYMRSASSGSSDTSRATAGSTSRSGSNDVSRTASNDRSRAAHEEASREKLMENVQNLANHADALLKATASVSSEGVALARRNLEDSLKSMRDQLDHLQQMATQRVRQAAQTADTYVRQHPWQAVGVAAFAGFFVSLLGGFARRRVMR